MKYNRICRILAIVLSVSMLSGCGDMPDLDDEKSDMIAEYAAGVLLRYSDRYQYRLITSEQLEKEDNKAEQAAEKSEKPLVTPSPTPVPTGESDSSDGDQSESTDAPDETVSLDEVYDVNGLHFTYVSSEFKMRYSADRSVSEIAAKDDEVLLVAKFNVKNTSSKKKKVDLSASGIEYELEVDSETVMPSMSILPNGGLNFLNTTIKAKRSEEAVLIFNLDKDKKGAKGMTLSIRNKGRLAKLNL